MIVALWSLLHFLIGYLFVLEGSPFLHTFSSQLEANAAHCTGFSPSVALTFEPPFLLIKQVWSDTAHLSPLGSSVVCF